MTFFSLIIPAYNRERQLRRAVDSALAQDFASFEVIVIDDASTDGTLAVARSYADPRVRVVARPVNGGPCPARNAGVDAARGQWLVMLDSDFSLRPGALTQLHSWCEAAAPTTGNCISACTWDNGWVTPRPPPPATLDYRSYLVWLEKVEIPEYFNCIRREVFSSLRYTASRAWEASFHLELARRWTLEFHAAPQVLVHTDATNRLTSARGGSAARRMLVDAPDRFADAREIVTAHGAELRRSAPTCFAGFYRECIKQALLCGDRGTALRLIREDGNATRWDARMLVIVAAGLVHRRVLAALNARR
ncbi:glycosyltransferase family 2 protein [Horticoccus sp. 23ND18S-11]|uniref:glycosyltransferase family 2 protein n=1 Tax=Horticoccus sp. 23ND18S-11 TaxID=3391832 RepID=UPI0039C9CFE5